MAPLDLTPFGFTPTETLAYQALLDLGPASGYAVAKHLGIARANAYQALHGLVGKGGAALVEEQPRRFRGVQPPALLARIADAEARKLDRLEAQMRAEPGSGADALVPLAGVRSVQDVATRTVVRAQGLVHCLSPLEFLRALVPALRKRDVDGNPAAVWCVGSADSLDVAVRGEVPASALEPFGGAAVLIAAPDAGLAAALGAEARGYWTSDRILVALIEQTIRQVTT